MTDVMSRDSFQAGNKQAGRPYAAIEPKTALAERLQQLFPPQKRSELQEILGLKRNATNARLSGGMPLKAPEVAAISEKTGCGVKWLTTGQGEKYPGALFLGSMRVAEDAQDYSSVRVRCLSYAAADATRGRVLFDDLPAEEDYVLPSDCVLMTVHGNSMADVAWDGQRLILAGTGRSAHSGDLIVAMVNGHGCLFKRLIIESIGDQERFILLSANANEPQPVLSVPPEQIHDVRVVMGVIYE